MIYHAKIQGLAIPDVYSPQAYNVHSFSEAAYLYVTDHPFLEAYYSNPNIYIHVWAMERDYKTTTVYTLDELLEEYSLGCLK